MTRGERRDFLLDSGAVSALAGDDKLLDGYRRLLELAGGGSLHIPSPVFERDPYGRPQNTTRSYTEWSTGSAEPAPRSTSQAGVHLDKRAGQLRFEAEKALGDKITGVDGQVVAIVERRSLLYAVTIFTTDPIHIQALVDATGRKNIDVDTPN